MNFDILKNLKAVFLCTAFLFFSFVQSEANTIIGLKQKTTELLLQKKKSQAVELLTNYIKAEVDQNNKSEAREFLGQVAQSFIFHDAQEAYEASINQTLENAKEAMKNNNQCLKIEPQQLECLIQKVRLFIRNKDNKQAAESVDEIKKLVSSNKHTDWLGLLLIKNKPEFKNTQIIRYLPSKNSEDSFKLILLELDRCLVVKNYSRVKEMLLYLEKNYADWPDLVFYKYKLNLESSEEKLDSNAEADAEPLKLYKNKCKSLSKTIARKFRFDFDLCARGVSL